MNFRVKYKSSTILKRSFKNGKLHYFPGATQDISACAFGLNPINAKEV